MKRILIFIPYFGIGGTISSLKAFLDNVDPDILQIDIFARKHTGEYLDRLSKCNILPENVFLSSEMYSSSVAKRLLCRGLHAINYGLLKIGLTLYPITCKIGGHQIRTQDYDAIISYQENLSAFISYIPAKKRIAWIRSEYERYIEGAGHKFESRFYRRIDTVVAVSDFARDSFLKVHPWHTNVMKINNFMNVDAIREMAKDKTQILSRFSKGEFTIVSIGRLDPVKQFEFIPDILHNILVNSGKDVRWYIVGGSRKGGSDVERKINDGIEKYHLQGKLVLLPETTNPYAYLDEADLFVHTSKSETYSRVVAEAKSVGTPVVVNNFPAAYEFVKDGEDGRILPTSSMASEISKLIKDTQTYQYYKENLQSFVWYNDRIMNQTIELINN